MTPKQQRFVAEIAKGKNATDAAIAAGYSPKTARSIASENLTKPDIQAALDAINAKSDAATGLSAATIKADLYAIHKKAADAEQYGAAVTALGKILDKCAPDLADGTLNIRIVRT